MKPNQIDVLALSMLRGFEEVEHAKEARRQGKLWRDIREPDLLD